MPFQGTKDNSAQILQFLASQRQQRLENERRDKELQHRQVIDMLNARAKARKEKTEAEKDKLEIIKMRREAAAAKEEGVASATKDLDAAEAAVDPIANRISTDPNEQLGQQAAAVSGEGIFGKGAGVYAQTPEAQVQAANDIFKEAEDRAYKPTFQKFQDMGYSRTRALDLADVQRQRVRLEREAELKKKVAEEDRAEARTIAQEERARNNFAVDEKVREARAKREADRAADRAAESKGKGLGRFVEQLNGHRESANNEELSQDQRLYHAKVADVMQEELESSRLRNLGDEAVKQKDRVRKGKQEYRQLQSLIDVFEGALNVPEVFGPSANISRFVTRISGLQQDFVSLFNQQFQEDVRKNFDSYTPEIQRELSSLLDRGRLVDGTLVQEKKLAEISAAWFVMRTANPSGRTSNEQIKQLLKIINTDGILTPSSIGVQNTGAVLTTLLRQRQQNQLALRDDGVEFDETGRLKDDVGFTRGLSGQRAQQTPTVPENVDIRLTPATAEENLRRRLGAEALDRIKGQDYSADPDLQNSRFNRSNQGQ